MGPLAETAVFQVSTGLLRGNVQWSTALKEKRHVIVRERVPAGDADDRILFGRGKTASIIALNIQKADPGRNRYIGRGEGGIIGMQGRCVYSSGEVAVNHKASGKRNIRFIMFITVPDVPHIRGSAGE
jgi:hypothetical protein